MIETLERETGIKLALHHEEECRVQVEELINKYEIPCSKPRTLSRMLDKLVGHFIEDNKNYWGTPYFICDHPAIMSPLAKPHRSIPGLTERFELFVAETELCNAYTELNDPGCVCFCFPPL